MYNQEKNTMTRRDFIGSASVITAGLFLMPKEIFARQESPVTTIINAAKTAKINVTSLRGNISMVEGSGGNIAVLNGPKGKLLVDAGIGVSKPNVLPALNSISKSPIKYLVNTHWHFDHADGNEWVNQAGATIIAHENTRKHLNATVKVEDWNYTFPPAPKGALPTVTFKTQHSLTYNRETIMMKKYKAAHTDSDISVYFPQADILHVGDTLWNGHYPFVDYSTGGSIDGMIAAVAWNIENCGSKTIVIPGHGPIADKSTLLEFQEMMTTVREKVASLKKQGMSLEDVIAAKPTAAYDEKYGGFVIKGNVFAYLVYKGV
ncbi:MBL fold metallo-hydrolase [Pedobacter panaciterrae]|uniref:MBL fold metallo-hydrolase n=1 Tax=Pedobacter panaciterrae TaxID=363849 RepID=UPI0025985137|nr:MBL fold metallo-hydrolase [uncultured Pedobacter sp.]